MKKSPEERNLVVPSLGQKMDLDRAALKRKDGSLSFPFLLGDHGAT
jgi:hypothetical protein